MKETVSTFARVATAASLLLSQFGSITKFDGPHPAAISDNPAAELIDTDLQMTDQNPNDPLFPTQWNLQGEETFGTNWLELYTRLQRTPPEASQPITIAIMDSGNNQQHPELQEILWTNQNEIPNNLLDDDGNGYIDDVHGCSFVQRKIDCKNLDDISYTQHGTGTTGVIAAITDNEIGIAGTASLLPIKIMPIKVIQPSGIVNYSDITIGLSYTLATRPDILLINIAGWPLNPPTQAYTLLQQIHDAGVIIIAGAGNSYTTETGIGWPARDPHVIAVGAYGKDGLRYPSSSIGPELWISAPGEAIKSTCYDGSEFNDYCTQGGTSFSGPHVASAAALILTYRPGSTLEDVKELLRLSAGEEWTPDMGYGRLNFERLANYLEIQKTYDVFLPITTKQ